MNILVYNDKEGYLYVHHDILMLNMPLCLTWLDYDSNNADAGLNIENEVFYRKYVCFYF
jgi:periodic tryptophan protein 1